MGSNNADADPVLIAVRTELLHAYYRPIPANVLNAPSVSSMLGALHDPYTDYLDATQFRLLSRETHSELSRDRRQRAADERRPRRRRDEARAGRDARASGAVT